jgi:tripartite ATP-independent transporter DctM subunit
MFGFMLLMLATGLPVAFVLGGTAVLFGTFMWGPDSVNVVIFKASDIMRESVLVAVPLFVFMACMLERSGIAEALYDVLHRWLGPLRGGLSAGTVIGCTFIAAMSGISTTGVLMMGIIGYPAMVRRGYDRGLAMGAIMAGGALGPLIPPSVVMIVYAVLSELSVGKLFLGGVVPGLILVALFITYVLVRSYFQPEIGPALPLEERATWNEKFRSLKGIVLPISLIVAVLGSIFAGMATPTEAASVGAFGAIVSAAVHRRLSWSVLMQSSFLTLRVVAMVMWIVFAASVFASIYQGLGASSLIQGLLTELKVSPWVVMAIIQVVWIILGSLMDALSILLITAPVFLPVAAELGFDPLWFGILYVVNTEMGYLTPPFGVNLFVMRGIVASEGVGMGEIYRAALPFIILQFIGLLLIIFFPALATWLPNTLLK